MDLFRLIRPTGIKLWNLFRLGILLPSVSLIPEFTIGDDAGVPHKIAGDYIVSLTCGWNFTSASNRSSDSTGEFRSPNHPNSYPNRSECLDLLIAPKGQRIRIDFGENFHIESSDHCEYDFIEFRDGPFGYSPVVGRYCGSRRPPIIESKSRFMWIRFRSDDYIEYEGFKAVYEFFVPNTPDKNQSAINSAKSKDTDRLIKDDVCRIRIDTSLEQGYLSNSDISETFLSSSNRTGDPLDCTWILYSPPKYRVYLRWVVYQMPSPHSCDDSYYTVYERTTAETDKRRIFCGAIARDLQSTSNHIYIRLYSKSVLRIPTFKILFTLFLHGPCSDQLFHCGDNTCINKSLVCNDQVNCNHSWDEVMCQPSTDSTSTVGPVMSNIHTLTVSAVSIAIFSVIILVCCVACRQRHLERQLHRQALKQDARHAFDMELSTNLLTVSDASAQKSVKTTSLDLANNLIPLTEVDRDNTIERRTTINGVSSLGSNCDWSKLRDFPVGELQCALLLTSASAGHTVRRASFTRALSDDREGDMPCSRSDLTRNGDRVKHGNGSLSEYEGISTETLPTIDRGHRLVASTDWTPMSRPDVVESEHYSLQRTRRSPDPFTPDDQWNPVTIAGVTTFPVNPKATSGYPNTDLKYFRLRSEKPESNAYGDKKYSSTSTFSSLYNGPIRKRFDGSGPIRLDQTRTGSLSKRELSQYKLSRSSNEVDLVDNPYNQPFNRSTDIPALQPMLTRGALQPEVLESQSRTKIRRNVPSKSPEIFYTRPTPKVEQN